MNVIVDALPNAIDGTGGGSYTLSEPLTLRGPLYMDGGEVLAGGSFSVADRAAARVEAGGSLELSSGSSTGVSGVVDVQAGGVVTVSANGEIRVDASGHVYVDDGGKLTARQGGDIDVDTGGRVNVAAGGSLNVNRDAALDAWSGSTTFFRNGSTVRVLGDVFGLSGASLDWDGAARFTGQLAMRDAFVQGDLAPVGSGRIRARRKVVSVADADRSVSIDDGDLVHVGASALTADRNYQIRDDGAEVGDTIRFRNLSTFILTVSYTGGSVDLSQALPKDWADLTCMGAEWEVTAIGKGY